MEQMNARRTPLWIGLGIPVGILLLMALAVTLPRSLARPQHDFLYAVVPWNSEHQFSVTTAGGHAAFQCSRISFCPETPRVEEIISCDAIDIGFLLFLDLV
jgi:hypothetical protein